jgi:NDP-sugar pyrophosphorylase family protein
LQTDEIRIKDLFREIPDILSPLFNSYEFPWEIIGGITNFTKELVQDGIDEYTEYKEGVLVGHDVKIYDYVTIEPPTVIGHGVVLRPGAFIRGSVIISEGSVVGNSTEIKNSVLLPHTEVPHYNYVGDSVLGYRSHLGAGAVCSNLKNDKRNITVHGMQAYETGLRKLGAILGDGANVGCGCILNPGCVIGRDTMVYPNLTLRGVYPSNSIVKSVHCVIQIENKN